MLRLYFFKKKKGNARELNEWNEKRIKKKIKSKKNKDKRIKGKESKDKRTKSKEQKE